MTITRREQHVICLLKECLLKYNRGHIKHIHQLVAQLYIDNAYQLSTVTTIDYP